MAKHTGIEFELGISPSLSLSVEVHPAFYVVGRVLVEKIVQSKVACAHIAYRGFQPLWGHFHFHPSLVAIDGIYCSHVCIFDVGVYKEDSCDWM